MMDSVSEAVLLLPFVSVNLALSIEIDPVPDPLFAVGVKVAV